MKKKKLDKVDFASDWLNTVYPVDPSELPDLSDSNNEQVYSNLTANYCGFCEAPVYCVYFNGVFEEECSNFSLAMLYCLKKYPKNLDHCKIVLSIHFNLKGEFLDALSRCTK